PTAASTKAAQLAASVTSSSNAKSASISPTLRAPPATRAPSAPSARTVAAPIPLDAPVTIAVLPLRARFIMAFVVGVRWATARQGRRPRSYAGIRARLRTPHRAAQRGPTAQASL